MDELEQIKQKYQKLPKYVRDAIADFDVASVVQEIVQDHHLHIDQGGELAQEINSVLIGDTKRDEFLPNIKQRLNISDQAGREIVKEVNENIFVPIKKQMQEKKEEEVAEKEPSRERAAQQLDRAAEYTGVDKEALAHIEKDKYRTPIENEDITFDASGIPTNNPNPEAPQAGSSEGSETRASLLKEIEDTESPNENPTSETGEQGAPAQEKPDTANQQAETKPRASMVRDLMNEKTAADRVKPKHIAKAQLDAADKKDEGVEKAAADKINQSPVQNPSAKKTGGDDPYREPID